MYIGCIEKINMKFSFNKPYLSGKETDYIINAVASGKIPGNGKDTQLCQNHFQNQFGFHKCLLTSSCTDALGMAAILLNIETGDEVFMPSYTFLSTANAFVLRGATIVFADSIIAVQNDLTWDCLALFLSVLQMQK